MDSIPSTSKEYVKVPGIAGATGSMPVEMAVIPTTTEEPAESDWHTAAWDGTTAKILIGPSTSLPLANGRYNVWVRITAAPEKPVIKSGTIRIT